MGNSLESYFDFAENDYLFFRQAYDSNVVSAEQTENT